MADRWDDERYRDEWERGRRYRGEGYSGEYGPPGEREGGRRGDWGRDPERGEYGRGGDWGRDYDREYGRAYPGRRDWRQGDREDRGFFERAGDEIRSWFGDEEARRRRTREEGRYGRGGYGGGYGWPGTWGYGERYGSPERGDAGRREERDWARQWGWMDDREAREHPELRRWNRREGAETRGPLDYRRSGDYGYGRGESGWGEGGHPEAARRGDPSYAEGRRGDDWGRGETWRYSETWVLFGPFVGRGPRNYQRSDDRIREEICERMSQHGQLDASGLEVRVRDGEATLSGTVSDRQAKRLADDIADSVSGVREVHNQLRVSPPAPGQPGPQGQQDQQGWQEGDERQRAA